MISLINFSSGIDSSYLAWKYLSENKNIILHHCKIINPEFRGSAEQKSANNIVEWFKKNNLSSFIYKRTNFDYLELNTIIRDIEIIGFLNAIFLRNSRYRDSIVEIAVSANAHDESNDPTEFSVVNRAKLLDTVGYDGASKLLTFPMLNKTKTEIIDEMPKDLFALTWYCRYPISIDKNGRITSEEDENFYGWKNCLFCKTCLQVHKACEELDLLKYHLEKVSIAEENE